MFVSGHTHSPSSSVECDTNRGDLLMLSAGAAVPPGGERDGYGHTYNKLAFEWDDEEDGLVVEIAARTWSAEATRFVADSGTQDEPECCCALRDPTPEAMIVGGHLLRQVAVRRVTPGQALREVGMWKGQTSRFACVSSVT